MKKIFIIALLGLFFAVPVVALATATVTWIPGQNVKIIDVAWTSDAAGDYVESVLIDGFVFGVRTVPSAVVGDVPTTLYDIYLRESVSDYSWLTTTLENRSATVTEFVYPATAVPIYGPAKFSVDAAGDTNSGHTFIYVYTK